MRKIPFGEIIQKIVDIKPLEEKINELQKYSDDIQLKQFLRMVYDTEKYSWKITKFPKDYKTLNPHVHIDRADINLRFILKDLELFRENVPFLEKRMLQKFEYILTGLHNSEVELLKCMFIHRKIKGIPKVLIDDFLK